MPLAMNIGSRLKHDGLDVDPNIVSQGLKDAMTGAPSKISEADAQAGHDQAAQQGNGAEDRRSSSRPAKLTRRRATSSWQPTKPRKASSRLPDGLQYKVLKAGTGPKPKATDTVTVNYRGTLIDGTEFDSS